MSSDSLVRGRCGRADLENHLRSVVFGPTDAPDLVGMEVEVFPVDAATGRVLPVQPEDPSGRASGPVLRDVAARSGWRSGTSPGGAPVFHPTGGGQLSFEPGGQLEYSSPPHRSVDLLVEGTLAVLREVDGALRRAGAAMVARGVDPLGRPEDAPLRLAGGRYARMAAHYERRGPWGRVMMRQSAAVHVNVDLGPDPLLRWGVLRRAVPGLLAAFANSPRAEGRDTGHRSWRAHQWRRLDPSRTGLPAGGSDPVSGYLRFALGADAFLLGEPDAPAEPLSRWVDRGVGMDDVRAHLTTLFPEVRPRGYLEVRCFDALPARWLGVPAVICAGLAYDPETLAEADATLPEPTGDLLERAGREGVRSEDVRARALRVLDLGMRGASRLPRGMVGEGALARAEAFRDRFTARGRDPGDEPGDGLWEPHPP